ncbi:MAG: hypothetical protein DI537_09335 [Stutzerimonas stutzeri]|nr:MAG: hypothetical protein DI537_09335 [Stutzerimonas stutzeri]
MAAAFTRRFDAMALAMSRPFTTKQGPYDLNVKVPKALRAQSKGRRVSLPVAGEQHSVMIGEKLVLSLRTKARRRQRRAFAWRRRRSVSTSWP